MAASETNKMWYYFQLVKLESLKTFKFSSAVGSLSGMPRSSPQDSWACVFNEVVALMKEASLILQLWR